MTLHRPQITEQVRPNSVEQPARQPSTGKMARKVDKTPKLCVICGDKAKGINFNALTCMSCKAFFRRNALRNKEMKCPFNDSCQVDKITRKFCSKCRLKKCFDLGMKKEWILSDEEKRLIKEKIMRNRIRRQQQEMESQQPTTLTTPQSGMSGKRRSMESQLKLSGGSVGGKLQSTGKRRATAANKSTNFIHSGKGASFRNRTMTGNGYEANSSATNSSSTSSGNSHLFTTMSTNSSPYTQSSTASFTGNSSSSSSKYPAAAAINAYNIFQEPSAYSLDILLSDNCDAFFESGGNGNSLNSNTVPQNNSALEEWLYNNSNGNTTTNAQGQDKPMTDPKKDDFLQSLSGEIDDPMALNTALNDCCNLLFSNNINSIDLFENENEIDGLTFSGSSSGISDCNESNQSPMYENQSITTGTGLVSDLVEIKKDLLAGENVSTGHITSVTTGSNSTFEYSQVKPENDFTQYLLHDNDPTFNLAIMNPPAPATNNNNRNLLLNPSTTKTVNFQALNSNLNSHANNQIAITQKNFAPSWDNSNALQVVSPRYSSNETYSSKSKVPPLVKMTTNPGTSTTNAESNDFISTCLISTNDQAEDSCNYDPVIEFVPRIGANDVMFREIGFSNRELILPERCLIKELTDACTVLKNPYKRILVFNNYDSVRSCRITEYSFHRLIRMSKRLSRFSQLPLSDQAKMLKFSLLEMLAIRSVLVYNPDRESWGFIDDKCKVNVMVRMDVIRPFCTKCGFQRHKNFPNLFRHEWKNDNIIFDLLTAIVLFTPRPGMCEYEKIKEEHLRYVYLLRRYLEIKYPTIAEAKESFSSLMSHVEEMKHLNADIVFFFQSYSQLLQTSPLFTQLLDLDPSNSAPVPTKPANSNTDTSFGSTSHVFDDPNMFSNLDVNSQLDNMVGAASTGPSSSTSPVSHFGQNTYTGSMDTSTVTSEPGSVAGNASNGSMSFGVGVNNSNSTNSSSNAYRECILNST